MANCKKYARSSLGNMFAHYDRSSENGKEHIDWSRTHLNYNLAPNTEAKQITENPDNEKEKRGRLSRLFS